MAGRSCGRRRGVRFSLLLFALGGITLVTTARSADNPKPQKAPRLYEAPTDAQTIGRERCLECHAEKREKLQKIHSECESCHRAGSKHVENPSRETIAYPNDTACLVCHQYSDTRRLTWKSSEHRQANLVCMDCHSIHQEPFRKTDVRFRYLSPKSALCLKCHTNKVGQFRMTSHHPVLEGAMNCVGCHNPHEDRRLQATSGTNDLCYRCHQEKRGPWVYEHQPVSEDCMICHNPHGSVSRRLLRKNEPYLCLTCHSVAINRHVDQASTGLPGTKYTRAFFTRCSDCHGALHGTHQDEWLRR